MLYHSDDQLRNLHVDTKTFIGVYGKDRTKATTIMALKKIPREANYGGIVAKVL